MTGSEGPGAASRVRVPSEPCYRELCSRESSERAGSRDVCVSDHLQVSTKSPRQHSDNALPYEHRGVRSGVYVCSVVSLCMGGCVSHPCPVRSGPFWANACHLASASITRAAGGALSGTDAATWKCSKIEQFTQPRSCNRPNARRCAARRLPPAKRHQADLDRAARRAPHRASVRSSPRRGSA